MTPTLHHLLIYQSQARYIENNIFIWILFWKSFFLILTEGPVEIVTHLKDVEVKETQSARFEVELNKSNVPVTWFLNGAPITKSNKNASFVDDGKHYALILKKCDPSHVGRYSVKTPGPASSASLFIEG